MIQDIKTILMAIVVSTVMIWGFASYYPLFGNDNLGATLTTLNSSDNLTNFPTTYNANNAAINAELALISGTTTIPSLTTLASLDTVGTITTGTWNADTLTVDYGGTGSTTLTSGGVLYGLGTSAIGATAACSDNQVIQWSSGVPTCATYSIDETGNYTWTGTNSFAATTTFTGDVVGASITKSFTAGEAISAGEAVRIEKGGDGILRSESTYVGTDNPFGKSTTYTYEAVKFTVPAGGWVVEDVQINRIKKSGSPTNNVEVFIVDDNSGTPTLTSHGTSTGISGSTITTSYAAYEFNFPNPVGLAAGTYWFALQVDATKSDTNFYNISADNCCGTDSGNKYSADGASWTNTYYMSIGATHTGGTVGSVTLANAGAAESYYSDPYIGIAMEDIASSSAGMVMITGTVTTSGLTAGAKYYLSDTAGAISSTVGTTEVPVGVALSATELLVK